VAVTAAHDAHACKAERTRTNAGQEVEITQPEGVPGRLLDTATNAMLAY
jgi:hypothetical protein